MKPTYKIQRVDRKNWRVVRTERRLVKTRYRGKLTGGEVVKDVVTTEGYFHRLDHAGMAVYELVLKDSAPDELPLQATIIERLLTDSRQQAEHAVLKAMSDHGSIFAALGRLGRV